MPPSFQNPGPAIGYTVHVYPWEASFPSSKVKLSFPVFFNIANKTKVLYGLQPEPDLGITIEDDNEEEEDKDKPKVSWEAMSHLHITFLYEE